MNEDRKMTPAGGNLVKHFEGLLEKCGDGKYKPYKCPANVLTIGLGHTNHTGRKFDASARWTYADCRDAFVEDMETFERAVRKHVRVPLTKYQFDALVSFTFNCGEGALAKSTLLKRVNAGDHKGAASEFHKWNKAGGKVLAGLTRRRASESLLYQGIPDTNYDGKADPKPTPVQRMPQAVDPPED
jgi:lysozyme